MKTCAFEIAQELDIGPVFLNQKVKKKENENRKRECYRYDANLYRTASEEEIQSKLFKTTGGPGYYVDTRKF